MRDATELGIDEVAWAEAVGRLSRPDAGDPGLTATELADSLGRDIRVVRAMLRRGLADGTVLLGSGYRQQISGSMRRVPVYRPAERGKRKR